MCSLRYDEDEDQQQLHDHPHSECEYYEPPQSREDFEAHIHQIVSGLRNCNFVSKSFVDFMKHPDDSLTRSSIKSLKPGVIDLLSLAVESLTSDDFAAFPRMQMVQPVTEFYQPQVGGVYVLLIESADGVE